MKRAVHEEAARYEWTTDMLYELRDQWMEKDPPARVFPRSAEEVAS